MAITITQEEGMPAIMGSSNRQSVLNIAFDSSYDAGGESVTPAALGFSKFDIVRAEPKRGFMFDYDYTNNKLKVYRDAPALVVEEKHTSASKVINLDYPPAWIVGVSKASTGMIQKRTGTSTAALGTNGWCLTSEITDGGRATIHLQASATVYVTYITQAWKEIYDLLVQNESITAIAAGVTPANTMFGFGYAALTTGTSLVPITDSDTAAAGEVNVDLNTRTGALKFHSSSSGVAYSVTYLKAPPANSWLADRLIADEDPSTGNVSTFAKPVACWLYSGYSLTSAGTANKLITRDGTQKVNTFKVFWGESAGTASTTGRTIGTPLLGGGVTTGMIHDAFYVTAHPWEIPTVPLEIPNGTDLSGLTGVKAHVVGR